MTEAPVWDDARLRNNCEDEPAKFNYQMLVERQLNTACF